MIVSLRSALAFVLCSLSCSSIALPAQALEITERRLDVAGSVDTKDGAKLAADMLKLNEAGSEPIYLLVTATGGSAQGVMLVADAIRALESPVVAVVLTPVRGAGAALPLFADRLVMMPSAELVFTEVEYEGIAKPKEPEEPDKAKPPTPGELFLQKVRADYLERFWVAVARRLKTSPDALTGDIESRGGRVVTAKQALGDGVAFEIATSLVSERGPSEKVELKITTTRKVIKTVPAEEPPNVQ